MSPIPRLFQPVKVGNLSLRHRVVMAPLTRMRANMENVHRDLAVEYYSQRASTPRTLLISEANFIHPKAGIYPFMPGIWNEEQVAAWKRVIDAVHAKGSHIFCQLWALGRAADPEQLEKRGFPYISASDIPMIGRPKPRPLTTGEIQEYIQWYTTAAETAIKTGFDGVELHGSNGYLIDQFLQDVTNNRADKYGGSIENRARFALDVIDSVTKVIGASKTGIRLSPWDEYLDMRMKDPIPTFSYLASKIAENYPDFAYLHVIESRVTGNIDREHATEDESNDFLRKIWAPRPFISAGGYTRETALEVAEENGDLIAFGRSFIADIGPNLSCCVLKT
ncbi:hypothetical protein AcV5_008187 [Taiwanofungus camphoratus]|nr:hypothetical protein AcV5_008187 [Antrodia cinnamomea]